LVDHDEATTDDLLQIVAPVDGVVTDIVPNRGELVAANVTAINMVTKSKFTVDALVPEADIAKVAPSQPAEITLDAYGDTVKFAGAVIAEDPDQTKVSDAIYYKTTLSIDSGDRDVKPGMTANVTIDTGDRTNALIIPTRAIRESNGVYTVRVIEGGTPREVTVTIGLRGDDGKTEALSGVSEGMQIVTGETGTP
jgi:HlyD family secretion protein/macrolide-specific efflux system membrane fusion protein